MITKAITVDKFSPRFYQLNLVRAFEEGKKKRFIAVWPRRAGKDLCAFSLLIRAAFRRVGQYFYVFPTFSSARRILWSAIDIDGNRVIDYYLPPDLVAARNEQQMSIKLVNGSQIQLLGSDDADKSLVGTNAVGMIFSEYALQNDMGWKLSIPILKASNGWAMFVTTVRGRNFFYDFFENFKNNPEWFVEKLTSDDTQHISKEEIDKLVSSGEMSASLVAQEFYNDWNQGIEGSYYGKYIDNLRAKNQITTLNWEPYLPVHTAWDLGYNDPSCIIFFQVHANQVCIIDYYENNKEGLEHYAKIIKSKPYTYGKHIAPFDIGVHELTTGITRWKMMHDLGITFVRYSEKQCRMEDGIENVRKALPSCWFDERACKQLIKALENYRQEWDEKRKVHKDKPLHDNNSHGADAMRYLCTYLPKLSGSSSAQEWERMYQESVGRGPDHGPIFSSNHRF